MAHTWGKMDKTGQVLNRMNLKKQYFIVKKLEALYKSGKPLAESFEYLSRAEPNASLRNCYAEIYQHIKEGASLADSISMTDDILDDIYVSLIHVGEKSGKLDEVLAHIGSLQAALMDLQKRIIGASIYPVVVLSIYFFVILIFLFVIIPMLVGFMQKFSYEVPSVLLFIVSIYSFLFSAKIIGAIIIIFIISGLLLYIVLNLEPVSFLIARFSLFLPGFGRIIKLKNLYSYIYTLKICYDAGLSAFEASELSCGNVSNVYIKDVFIEASNRMKNGDTISDALLHTGYFDFEFLDLVRTGEESGRLDESYEEILKSINTKIQTTLLIMIGLLKPLGVLLGLLFIPFIFVVLYTLFMNVFSTVNAQIQSKL
jgi:type II secretory pathway component PulF